jgi:hypothetical protein
MSTTGRDARATVYGDVLRRLTMLATRTMGAAVGHDAAVGADEMREARCLAARVACRDRLLLAQAALEERAEPLSSAFGVDDPGPQVERRLVTDVPPMATRELGNPVAQLVSVVPDDRALHLRQGTSRR